MNIVIANTTIRTDAEGRYCLNDLHRAAGGEAKHQPAFWIRNAQTQALIEEMGASANLQTPVSTLNDGQNNGTYVAKELVYAYAMWISPAFHLKVIRAYDAMISNMQVAVASSKFYSQIPQTLPEALRLAAGEMEKNAILSAQNAALEEKVAEAAPKVQALDRIATYSDGSFCVRDAAKNLQVQEKRLRQWLSEHNWIYRRPMGSGWLAYSDKLKAGLLEHKITTGNKADGSEWTDTQVRVTAKGLAKLALLLPPDEGFFPPPINGSSPRPHV